MEHFITFTKSLFIIVVLTIALQTLLLQSFEVHGESMEPNFIDGERVIIDKLTPSIVNYKRGEVIIFLRNTGVKNEFLIKRVIGLPGERIVIHKRKITIYNDKNPRGLALNESEYRPRTLRDRSIDTTLEEDEYFVLGDNRPISNDSEIFGPIKRESIIGRLAMRFFPFDRMSLFPQWMISE